MPQLALVATVVLLSFAERLIWRSFRHSGGDIVSDRRAMTTFEALWMPLELSY